MSGNFPAIEFILSLLKLSRDLILKIFFYKFTCKACDKFVMSKPQAVSMQPICRDNNPEFCKSIVNKKDTFCMENVIVNKKKVIDIW